MTSYIEEKIYNEVEKQGKIRYNELRRIIVDKKKIISERPFREKLGQMVKNGLISRTQVDKQNVVYSTKLDWYEYQKDGEKLFQIMLTDFEEKLDKLTPKLNKLSNIEKANFIVSIITMISHLEWNFIRFSKDNENVKIKKQRQRLDDLKTKIQQIAFADDDEKKHVVSHMIDHLLRSQYLQIDASLENIRSF